MLYGGTEASDIYRHIDSGITGTPTPSFRDTLKGEPETIWNLVSYVLQVADIRREGSIPDSGLLEDGLLVTPPGVKPAASARAPATTRAALAQAEPVRLAVRRKGAHRRPKRHAHRFAQ